MKTLISAYNYSNFHSNKGEFNRTRLASREVELPTFCPVCHTALVPDTLTSVEFNEETDYKKSKLFSLNYCNCCKNCFISEHKFDTTNENGYVFSNSYPAFPVDISFSGNITKLSPGFIRTFNESNRAETLGLLSICGMGYRKSLEYLVKDFIIARKPELKEEIEKTSLSVCIQKHIDSQRLKTLATASAWIGNDETHYVRKHEDFGIRDLKKFIHAFVTYIDAELAYDEANHFIANH